jgi:adenylate kinase
MRLLLIAPPGAGKGTQAARIAEHFGIEHIATGDLLRDEVAAGTELGKQAKSYLDRGDLVPDNLVLAMVSARVKDACQKGGFVLDGFPRTVEQAEAAARLFAESGAALDAVVFLDVGREESLRRLLGRADQEGRSDDQEETIRHRLDVFETLTKPLVGYYQVRGLLIRIDGDEPVDTVTDAILKQLATRT